MLKSIISARFILALSLLLLSGCALMPHAGPGKRAVVQAGKGTEQNPPSMHVVKVDDAIAAKLRDSYKIVPFSTVFGDSPASPYRIGPGDMLDVSIWETPPAMLFKSPGPDGTLIAMGTGAETLPAQMVMADGTISIPFAGRVKVSGKSPAQVEKEIAGRLAGQANSPQVLVRVTSNTASQVAVIGDVNQSRNLSLTPRGEKVLDALASAGGVSQPLNKVSLQLSRKGVNARMPLDMIVADPKQNLYLQPGDVLAALFQPWSFSILGAAGKNVEVPFEASGISLAQALARSGGLNDFKADPGGVFIFRYEEAKLLNDPSALAGIDGRIPVVYQIDFNDPKTFFITQNFPMQDKDLIYIANMPSAELQKFMQMVGMLLSPALSIGNYHLNATD